VRHLCQGAPVGRPGDDARGRDLFRAAARVVADKFGVGWKINVPD